MCLFLYEYKLQREKEALIDGTFHIQYSNKKITYSSSSVERGSILDTEFLNTNAECGGYKQKIRAHAVTYTLAYTN